MDYPRLRYVEAFPLDHGTTNAFALRDPSGLAEDIVVVSGETLFFLQFFDGKHSLVDMRVEYMRAFGHMMDEQKLQRIVDELDRRHLLEGSTFNRYRTALMAQMMAEPARPAAHAGQSYEADPQRLRQQLDGFFTDADGAGMPGTPKPASQSTSSAAAEGNGKARPLAAIAPHIDLRAGGPCYSHTYRALLEAEPAEVFVILGTGHSGLQHMYSVLPKDFATPLGVVRQDAAFIKQLAARHSGDLFSEPLPHRREHTIEFQAVFLQHVFGHRHSFTIVPVLCSFAHVMLEDHRLAREKKLIEDFVDALRATIAADGRKICMIASVDFAHVGPRYGDQRPPDAVFLAQVQGADQRLLATIESVDAQAFYQTVSREQDRYRICGFAPIYTLLSATGATRGRALKYDRATVDDQHSTVSFASAVLY